MTPARKKELLQADLVGLQELARLTPEGPFGRELIEQRAEELRREIAEIPQAGGISPETEIFFGGPPVHGSEGIEAKFAADILDSYQDMVTNDFASRQGALRHFGRRHGESETRLFLTALPRGSVGLQLTQPAPTDFVVALQVGEAMEHVTELVQAASEGDEPFEKALEVFHPRVLAPLTRFLDTMTKSNVSCRIMTGQHDLKLEQDNIKLAYERVIAAKTEEETVEIPGTFGGVLLHSWRFDLQPQIGNVISGWLSDSVTDVQAAAMALLTGQPVTATLKMTSVSTTSGKRGPVYELLSLAPRQAQGAALPAVG